VVCTDNLWRGIICAPQAVTQRPQALMPRLLMPAVLAAAAVLGRPGVSDRPVYPATHPLLPLPALALAVPLGLPSLLLGSSRFPVTRGR
jgi:hypothetical protein